MKIQEASKDLQMGRILFPKCRGKLFEDEDLKTTENQRLNPGYRHHAPRAWKGLCCLNNHFVDNLWYNHRFTKKRYVLTRKQSNREIN